MLTSASASWLNSLPVVSPSTSMIYLEIRLHDITILLKSSKEFYNYFYIDKRKDWFSGLCLILWYHNLHRSYFQDLTAVGWELASRLPGQVSVIQLRYTPGNLPNNCSSHSHSGLCTPESISHYQLPPTYCVC